MTTNICTILIVLALSAPFAPTHAATVIDATIKIGLCGDEFIDTTEECDGAVLGEASCVTLGFAQGNLVCGLSCEFDTSGCSGTAPPVTTGNTPANKDVQRHGSAASAPPANSMQVGLSQMRGVLLSALRTLAAMIPPPLALAPASAVALSERSRTPQAPQAPTPSGIQTAVVPTRPANIELPPTIPIATGPTTVNQPRQTNIQQITALISRTIGTIQRILQFFTLRSAELGEMLGFNTAAQLAATALSQDAGSQITATITPLPENERPFLGRITQFFIRAFVRLWF